VFDETVILVNDQHYWLYAAVDPEINLLLHIRLFPMTTTVFTVISLREFREKKMSQSPCFSGYFALNLQTAFHRAGL